MKDLIIIGGSAAGAAAAIYAARRKLNFSLISEDFGGEMARSGDVWNYPGFGKTDGITLADKFLEHVKENDCEPELGVRVESITSQPDKSFLVKAVKNGEAIEYQSRTVIIATGVHPRHLSIPGEEEFAGKGVTYCTTCDGPLYRNKTTVTIGAGNSALESVLMLAEIADHATIISKYDGFPKGEQVLIDKVLAHPNITTIYGTETTAISGSTFVEGVTYKDSATGKTSQLKTNGVFVHIGMLPNTAMVPSELELDHYGNIEVNIRCETNIPGLFAAGDVTTIPYNQIAIASGQGVTAALSAIEYTNKLAA